MPDPTPSETLRAAAARLRKLAGVATQGRWEIEYSGPNPHLPQAIFRMDPDHPDDVDFSVGLGAMEAPADNAWVAAMSPGVAEPLARELEMHAAWLYTIEERDGDRASMGHALAVQRAGHMLAFARSILDQP
jgi:hypothetical protein